MLLKGKNAIIYRAGGAIGGAVAPAFAHERAKVLLTGRNLAAMDAVAKDIIARGGAAEAARVDALDERAVDEHIALVVKTAGRVDVSFNAIGLVKLQPNGRTQNGDGELSTRCRPPPPAIAAVHGS